MNNDYPPIILAGPTFQKRRPEKSHPIPLPPEYLGKRSELAKILGVKVEGLSTHLKSLNDEQRKVIFYKITHDGPVSLSGIGLKPLVDRSDKVTLAIPTSDSFDAFTEKIQELESASPDDDRVKNQDLVRIEDFAQGEPKDRLSDEFFADYDSMVKQKTIICEIEIWSLVQGKKKQRAEIATILSDLKNAFASGIHGTLFQHQEGDGICRAVIRCTGDMFRRLVEEDKWQRSISWFESKPKFQTVKTVWDNFQFSKLGKITPPDENAPTICIIDSGVSSGNPFLEPVAKEDMLKSFLKQAPEIPSDENGHGSGVASLAAYYAINLHEGAENEAKAWIASARILDASNQIEEECLFSKVIEEVVEEFVPHGVRIFNLSVANMAMKWNQHGKRTQPRSSWTARKLDQLSQKHDIIFVVSTGNLHLDQIRDYLQSGNSYPDYLCDEESRILDPGQAGLALSVGSIVAGTVVAASADTTIALEHEPSPFTRSGPGIKKELKPDLVEFGGNLIRNKEQNWVNSNTGTNIVMASHQLSPAATSSYGTSFAAPRVSHKLAQLLHELTDLGLEHVSAPLLKAFLVNSATYRGDLEQVKERLEVIGKKRWLDLLGYGQPDSTRATDCDDYSVLLFHQDKMEAGQVAFFDIPIPEKLSESSRKKRITVTVSHNPEVQKWGLENYYGIDLKWRMFRGDVDRDRVLDSFSIEDGTDSTDEEIELLNSTDELNFEHKSTFRSRGTIQHDWHEWNKHKNEFSANHYTLAISATKKWGRQVKPTDFAVVIRIEELGATVPIYNEIATEIETLIEQRAEI